jgi:iron(III) transport system substrate-binding protein
MKMTFTSTLLASALALAALTSAAQAKGRLVVYCSAPTKCAKRKPKPSAKNTP